MVEHFSYGFGYTVLDVLNSRPDALRGCARLLFERCETLNALTVQPDHGVIEIIHGDNALLESVVEVRGVLSSAEQRSGHLVQLPRHDFLQGAPVVQLHLPASEHLRVLLHGPCLVGCGCP